VPPVALSLTPLQDSGGVLYYGNKQRGGMTPNWIHNSGKRKNTKGSCKGKLKARKQALQHIKRKLEVIK
jgi:hypothetical protein